jgi:hypothetical protein
MDDSYLIERLNEMGISVEENNTQISYHDALIDGINTKPYKWIHTYDPYKSDLPEKEHLIGAIAITHKNLTNHQYRYKANNAGNSKDYFLYRIHPDKVVNGNKYLQPYGSKAYPFFTNGVIESYMVKGELERLYIVEGPIKAFALSVYANRLNIDFPIVGISGIHQFGQKEDQQIGNEKAFFLHEDIKELIKVCKPKKVVFIMDADLRQLPELRSLDLTTKDLSNRLYSFYSAVTKFNASISPLVSQVYLIHPSEKYLKVSNNNSLVKGIDDLFIYESEKHLELFQELEELTQARTFLVGLKIDSIKDKKLKEYFYLNSVNDFYLQFAGKIRGNDFKWRNQWYQVIDEVPRKKVSNEQLNYIRVGTQYFKIGHIISPSGKCESTLIPWKKETILEDYPKSEFKEFWGSMERFEAFCNIPENDPDKYVSKFQGPYGQFFYNQYSKLDHKINEGNWLNIEAFLRQLFADQYDVILDYLFLMYFKPIEHLPIIALVSQEKGTGKSTFLFFLEMIFQGNFALIGSQDLRDNFNADYITKLCIAVDEAILDNQQIIEKIKSLCVTTRTSLNGKFVSRIQSPFFGKFVFTSNNETTFTRIDEDETRFWVIKANKIQNSEPDLKEILRNEIPHFIYYLKHNHILKHPKESRHWFALEVYSNSALNNLKHRSVPAYMKGVIELIRDEFLNAKTNLISFTSTELQNKLNDPEYKYTKEFIISKKLVDDLWLSNKAYKNGPNAVSRKTYEFTEIGGQKIATWYNFNSQRFIDFYFEDWLNEQECIDLRKCDCFIDHIDCIKNTFCNKTIHLTDSIFERWTQFENKFNGL